MNQTSNELTTMLWNDGTKNSAYSSPEQYNEHILEQYKLYVNGADKISGRRDIANGFFLTLNGLVFGLIGVLIENSNILIPKWGLLFPLIVLLSGCYFRRKLIISYKQLNTAKYQIIGELEKRLPANLFGRAEWDCLLKKGLDKKTYWPLTHIESKIPILFGVGYVIATLLLWYVNK